MGRAPCCDKAKVKKGPWSPEEDRKLKEYIEKQGTGGNWISLPQKAGLRRCGKSCRLRWLNYLRPNIKHGEFSDDEDRIICTLFASIGSRWSIMAAQLPGRTDNDIKNYWNTKLKKKMMNLISSTPNDHQTRKSLHHLESFNSSSHCSYQSPSLFYKNNININTPLSSSTSTPSSYLYNMTTSSYDHDQTLSIASSPTAPVLDHRYVNVGPMQNYQVVKDSPTLLTFGGDQASCSSNSDGSYGVAVYDQNNIGNLHSFKGIGGNYEKASGYFGDSSLDSSLEEFKQLISTNLFCSNIDNNLNFFVDENNADEKVMYY